MTCYFLSKFLFSVLYKSLKNKKQRVLSQNYLYHSIIKYRYDYLLRLSPQWLSICLYH